MFNTFIFKQLFADENLCNKLNRKQNHTPRTNLPNSDKRLMVTSARCKSIAQEGKSSKSTEANSIEDLRMLEISVKAFKKNKNKTLVL